MEEILEATDIEEYVAYKDSGVEWLGGIPEEWELTRFKYLAAIQKGKLPKKIVSENVDDLPPYLSMEYLRGGEANQWVQDKGITIVKKDEILLLWDGSNAGEFIKSREGIISSTVAFIEFKNIDKRFAWYYSKFLEIELKKKTIGMGIPHVNGEILNNFPVLLPSKKNTKSHCFFS
jgi:type I restriction enzyme, S subunit